MDKDTNQVSESQATEKAKAGLSRRKLLRAGAVSAAVVPVMVTVRSASAHATGITKVNWGWGTPPEADVYGSITCVTHVKMPCDNDQAVRDICDKSNITYKTRYQCQQQYGGGWSGASATESETQGGVIPAGYTYGGGGGTWGGGGGTYSGYTDKPTCEQLYEYYGSTNCFNKPVFDLSSEKHCTYLEYTCTTGCLNSIIQQSSSTYCGGKTSWPKDGYSLY